ncbi:MAG: FAD-dependent oxidoreductase [Desulfitobacterium sp.]
MRQKFDVIVVGAGPAGATAAMVLAKSGLEVLLIERGKYPGEKNMFGGALFGRVLNDLIPNYWEEAPVERYITRKVITMLSGDSSFSFDFKTAKFGEAPYNGFSVNRSRFDRWYAQKAVEAGALLVTETVVDDLLWVDGRVAGVRTRRDQGEVWADVVIAADGVNSLLAQKAKLRKNFLPNQVTVGVKEVIQLPKATIESRFNLAGAEGVSNEFLGGLPGGVQGGGFIYTNKESLSVGVVAQFPTMHAQRVPIYEALEQFKSHPSVQGLLKDGVVKEYSAHMIPEAGLEMMPQLYTGGMLIAGDAAGFVLANGLYLEGVNFAIASGIAAAQTVVAAKEKGDYSSVSMQRYQQILEESFVLKDLRKYKHALTFIENPRLHTTYPDLICQLAEKLFTVDGHPHQKIMPQAKEIFHGQISWRELFKDVKEAGRALLW